MESWRSKNCEGCIYQKTFTGLGPYCDYLCMVGHSRPCPPGDECTEKIHINDRRKKERTPEEKEALAEWHRQMRREKEKAKRMSMTPEEIEKEKEKRREHNREQYQKHKEERNAKHKEYYYANKERLNAYSRELKRKKREAEKNGNCS